MIVGALPKTLKLHVPSYSDDQKQVSSNSRGKHVRNDVSCTTINNSCNQSHYYLVTIWPALSAWHTHLQTTISDSTGQWAWRSRISANPASVITSHAISCRLLMQNAAKTRVENKRHHANNTKLPFNCIRTSGTVSDTHTCSVNL